MIKNLKIPILYDTYGKFLSDFQQECIDCYYNQDLSFAEIAVNSGKSRQGVRDAVIRAEIILFEMDKKLNLVEKFNFLREKIRLFNEYTKEIKDKKLKEKMEDIKNEVLEIVESW